MSGPAARGGFAFQDLVLAERVLAHVIGSRAASITVAPLPPLQFWVEASPDLNTEPEWDLVHTDGTDLVLEEAKSGAVDADDRWALWRRVRRTMAQIAQTHSAALPIVQLSVNADNLPTKPENWRALAGQSQRVVGTWRTPGKDERRSSVSTAEDLANEALHILSSADADALSKPIDLSTARRLLARFSFEEGFGAASVEQRVREHLFALSSGVGVNELLNGLRGQISQRAESKDPAAHRFTSEELLSTFSMLERLATIDPATLRRWRTLRACATANASASNSLPPGGLPYQDWRILHPDLANGLGAGLAQPMAIVGRGGLGKSVVLRNWLAEQQGAAVECLLLMSTDLEALAPDELLAALDLGTFAAHHQGRKLFVGIDATENIAASRRNAVLAALRGTAENGAAVCVTCRLNEWRTALGTNEEAPGWLVLELGEWGDSRVNEHVGTSDRPNVGPDLRRLLRTPLLLDLFLRTFGRAGQVPPGLQSRHGLLDAYWNRRVLPANDGRSTARRSAILGAAGGEANGVHVHSLLGEEALQLASEGLFTLGPGGQYAFRHALLRDFAMTMWAHDGASSATQVSDKLVSIRSSLVKFGALRAYLEGSQLGTGEILRGLAQPLLSQAGTIVGEFDDLALVDVEQMVDAVASHSRAEFLSALLASVKLAQNGLWLVLLSNLPEEELWAERKAWLTGSVFQQLEAVVESMSGAVSLDPALRERIASRLRSWSSAPRLRKELAAGGGWTLGHLGRLLVKLDPTRATADWALGITATGAEARFWVLGELPALVQAVALAPAPDDALLRRLYISAAGLREEPGLLRDDPIAPRTAMSGHDRITACLINEGKGLLASRPSVFVPLAAELLAGHEQERAEDDREWHSRAHQIPDDQLSEVVEFFEPLLGTTERREAVRQVAERAAQQALAFATGGSADSVRFAADSTDAYWDLRDSEYYELLMHLRVMFEKSLSTSDSSFEQIYWPSVGASGSARLHTCILDLVTRTEPSPKPAVLDELLQDGRLYTLSYAHPYLQRGIRQRWPSLSPPVKHAILDNIRGSGLAPAGNLFFPGPLLFAIPQAERPPETKVFIELMEVAAHPLDLPEPRAAPFAIAVPHRMQPAPPVPIAGLSAARALPWQSIAELSEQDITACTADRWVVLVELVQRLIDECLPNPEHLIGHADLVERVANLVDALRRRASLGAGVGSDSLLSLANWSLSALSTFPDAEVTADCEPFSGTLVGLPPKAALWMAMARLTDRLLWHPSLAGQTALDGGLFAAIAVHAKAAPERFAYYLLTRISGWLRSDGAGRDALHVVLLESIRNGHVASEGLRWVERFTRPEQQVLLKNWLTTDHAQPMQHAHEFVRKAGQHIGWAGLVRYEGTNEPTGSHDIFEELVARPSLHGVLADPSLHAFFVGQAVYGAKLALVGGAVPLERATEFFLRIDSCWSSLLPTMSEDPTRDRPAVALWALSPILETNENSEHSLRTNDRLAWWRAASATALAIVRDGPWQEIDHLMGALGKSSLLDSLTVTALRPVLEALDARTKGILQAAPRYRWDHALTSAAVVIECVAPFTTDNAARDWLFSLLTAWAAAPLSNEKAAQVARGLRTAS